MKAASQQAQEVKEAKSIRADIMTEMVKILHDASASTKEKLEATKIILALEKIKI